MKKKIFLSVLLFLFLFFDISAQLNSVKVTPGNGSPTFYSSITAAYSAIPAAVTTSYLIEILSNYDGTDASEFYPIRFTDKGLFSLSYTITVRPASGNNSLVIKRSVSGSGAVVQINGGDNIILDGRPGGINSTESNYMSIIDIGPGDNLNRDIELLNGANNNIIQFINLPGIASYYGTRNIYIGEGASNNNNVITDCNITGGYRGVTISGLSLSSYNTGNVIKNNSIKNFYNGAMLMNQYQKKTTILHNRIYNEGYEYMGGNVIVDQSLIDSDTTSILENTIDINSPTAYMLSGITCSFKGNKNISRNIISLKADAASSFNGIVVSSDGSANLKDNIINNLSGSNATYILGMAIAPNGKGAGKKFVISGNRIYNLNSSTYAQITALSINNDSASITDVYNNFISLTTDNSLANVIQGISIEQRSTKNYATANVYFNTIRISGKQTGANSTSVYSAGIYLNDSSKGSSLTQKNNLIINERTGSVQNALHVSFYNKKTSAFTNIDHNIYYGTNSNKAVQWLGQTFMNGDIAGYRNFLSSINQEQQTGFTNASFVSNTDLHLTGFSLSDQNLLGIPISNITKDIDSTTRSTVNPTKGADEGLASSLSEICNNGNTTIVSDLSGGSYQWQVDKGTGFENIIDDVHYSGTNTLTLTISAAQSIWYGYRYRCLVGINYSSTKKLRFVSYWSGGTNSDWENIQNWSCGSLPDENTDVIINHGNCLLNSEAHCRSIAVRENANFTIKSGNQLISHY